MLNPFGNRVEDEPGWREKLAEWRDAPPWVPARPDWLHESPSAILLALTGLAFAALAAFYLAVPPAALPASMPGHFSTEKAAAEAARYALPATTTTTSTTVQKTKAEQLARLREVSAWGPEKRKQFWQWIAAVRKYREELAEEQKLLSTPAKPPLRKWDYAFYALLLGAGLFTTAWFVSETRARRVWGT